MVKISIIIPTYNEEEYLPQLLDSIKSQNFTDYEIIIADAQSKDQTRKVAQSYGCIIVEGGLPAIGRNNGAERAQGELLLFLDSDLILTEGYLRDTVEEFEHLNLGIAITQMIPLSDSKRDKILHEFANRFMIMVESIKPHGAGCYGIISQKELHDEIKGFDESLDFGEDTDYIERIGKISNFKVLRRPRVLVSIRRLEKEGLKSLAYKYSKSTIYDFMGKKVSADDLDYTFGYEKELDEEKPLPPNNSLPVQSERKRIIYSVCGEGMGHAIRSRVILEELSKDYDILIFASERAYQYLSANFDNVFEIYGFNTVYEDNAVKDIKTFVKSMKKFPRDLKDNLKLLYKVARDFKPHIIVSDFEFYASLLSKLLRIPMISIDNMHVITRCKIDYPSKYKKDKLKAEGVVRSFIVRPVRYIITSYFFPEIKNPEKTVMYPPILRNEIFKLNPQYGDYTLVYQTSKSNLKLIETLKENGGKFVVYGFDKESVEGNLQFKSFNEDQFFNDLANANAVITNGGFTLISEAIHLKKPVFSIPVKGQFEQILNAIYLDKLGYGELQEEINHKLLKNFIANQYHYRENLKNYDSGDNHDLINELKSSIEKYSKIK
ncbi:MJ1255/VC2487 family glycosyltransferase [Methanobacterium alcaliphilum]|uniref:MJ1255/VC2487 family glycosyltransferase n=1 Tax=Methanobacterium alcaliphilum TaxID=392018 RepID=UPI00200B670A|nr:MJ1255/VC2487 family glycosyltransferase [Methanobacterium alcaliphilum]MCK9150947.1 glycosyltransferase [Methanobacterium alcaliphilum]